MPGPFLHDRPEKTEPKNAPKRPMFYALWLQRDRNQEWIVSRAAWLPNQFWGHLEHPQPPLFVVSDGVQTVVEGGGSPLSSQIEGLEAWGWGTDGGRGEGFKMVRVFYPYLISPQKSEHYRVYTHRVKEDLAPCHGQPKQLSGAFSAKIATFTCTPMILFWSCSLNVGSHTPATPMIYTYQYVCIHTQRVRKCSTPDASRQEYIGKEGGGRGRGVGWTPPPPMVPSAEWYQKKLHACCRSQDPNFCPQWPLLVYEELVTFSLMRVMAPSVRISAPVGPCCHTEKLTAHLQ